MPAIIGYFRKPDDERHLLITNSDDPLFPNINSGKHVGEILHHSQRAQRHTCKGAISVVDASGQEDRPGFCGASYHGLGYDHSQMRILTQALEILSVGYIRYLAGGH
ncbi:hypothetical protein D3C84_1095840 [compost metagenome]